MSEPTPDDARPPEAPAPARSLAARIRLLVLGSFVSAFLVTAVALLSAQAQHREALAADLEVALAAAPTCLPANAWPADQPVPAELAALLPRDARLRRLSTDESPRPSGGWPERPTVFRNPDGELVFGAARAAGPDGELLVIEIPFSRAFAPTLSLLARSTALAVLLLIAVAAFSRRVAAQLVEPLNALSEAARRISEGNLDTLIPSVPAEEELGLLTRTFNEMTAELRRQRTDLEHANDRLLRQNQELQNANEVLGQLSITDGLTKLHNHRFFQDHLTREIKRVARTGEPLALLLIDIDDFKRLNDQLGHAAGDELLVRMAEILNGAVRDSDLVARYGGEEFVVLAANTDEPGAYALAEKIRQRVAEASFIVDNTMRLAKMTISIGVNAYRGSRKAFFQGADEALYQAKAWGKNQVVVHEPPASAPPRES